MKEATLEFITSTDKHLSDLPIHQRVLPCNVQRRRTKMTVRTHQWVRDFDIGYFDSPAKFWRWSTPEEVQEYQAWQESEKPLGEAIERCAKSVAKVRDFAEIMIAKGDLNALHALADHLDSSPSPDTTGLRQEMVIFTKGGQVYSKMGWVKDAPQESEVGE